MGLRNRPKPVLGGNDELWWLADAWTPGAAKVLMPSPGAAALQAQLQSQQLFYRLAAADQAGLATID